MKTVNPDSTTTKYELYVLVLKPDEDRELTRKGGILCAIPVIIHLFLIF